MVLEWLYDPEYSSFSDRMCIALQQPIWAYNASFAVIKDKAYTDVQRAKEDLAVLTWLAMAKLGCKRSEYILGIKLSAFVEAMEPR
jgi:hypothetical protein